MQPSKKVKESGSKQDLTIIRMFSSRDGQLQKQHEENSILSHYHGLQDSQLLGDRMDTGFFLTKNICRKNIIKKIQDRNHMINNEREEFFRKHDAKPCSYCLKIKQRGYGIGPAVAEILLQSFAKEESERLQRKLDNGGLSDARDVTWEKRNREMFIRACWLSGYNPEELLKN